MNNSQRSKLFLVPLLIGFGALNTILLQLQGYQTIGDNNKFFHPFIQVSLMFFGEFLCVIVFVINKKRKPVISFLDKSNFMKKQAPLYLPLMPASFDLIASTLAYVALSFTPASVWQMSRGAVIITTAILSKLILKTKFTKSATLGCFLTLVGITLVQTFTIVIKDEESEALSEVGTSLEILGVCLLVASSIFNSLCLISEKWIFQKYIMSPLKLVFLQGLYGFILSIGMAILASFLTCPWYSQAPQHCVRVQNQYYLESFSNFFTQIQDNTYLLILCISLIFSIGISVPIAVYISKYISVISRVLAQIARTVIIWLVGILFTLFIEKYKGLESLNPLKNGLKAIGFVVMIIGVLIYHSVIRTFKEDDERMTSLLSETDRQGYLSDLKRSTYSNKSGQSLN